MLLHAYCITIAACCCWLQLTAVFMDAEKWLQSYNMVACCALWPELSFSSMAGFFSTVFIFHNILNTVSLGLGFEHAWP
jgi:hypothetical protein